MKKYASNLTQMKMHFDNEELKNFFKQDNTYTSALSKIIGEKRNTIEKIYSIMDFINQKQIISDLILENIYSFNKNLNYPITFYPLEGKNKLENYFSFIRNFYAHSISREKYSKKVLSYNLDLVFQDLISIFLKMSKKVKTKVKTRNQGLKELIGKINNSKYLKDVEKITFYGENEDNVIIIEKKNTKNKKLFVRAVRENTAVQINKIYNEVINYDILIVIYNINENSKFSIISKKNFQNIKRNIKKDKDGQIWLENKDYKEFEIKEMDILEKILSK
jgi:hypothetical protein